MILARILCSEQPEDFQLAFARMGLPASARDYLMEKLPSYQILLTGLEPRHGRFVKQLLAESSAPAKEEYPVFISGDDRRRPGAALLSGRREQMEALIAALRRSPEQMDLAIALERALGDGSNTSFAIGGRRFEIGHRTLLMGVINVTPDSFSDGGKFLDPARAIEHGTSLAAAGADILDVGGESTRPGSEPVSAPQELDRILPVIRGLRKTVGVPISVDTYKAEVAAAAVAEGASMVNDISGFQFDREMPATVARAGVSCALMHIQGSPENMQTDPQYQDLVAEVYESLKNSTELALGAGIPRENICVDPGIGFGKTAEHNLLLLRRLSELRGLGFPILVGTSRKSFIGKICGGDPEERLAGTVASIAIAAANRGADIVRVHDVHEAKCALTLADAIRDATGGGSLFSLRPD